MLSDMNRDHITGESKLNLIALRLDVVAESDAAVEFINSL